jgi:hypothetical protein
MNGLDHKKKKLHAAAFTLDDVNLREKDGSENLVEKTHIKGCHPSGHFFIAP